MSNTGLPTSVCLLRNEHDAHDWWYTSEGGGHMTLSSDVDAKGFKAHHCPGKLAQATTPMSDTGAVERAARVYVEAGTADYDAMSPRARERLLLRMGAALAAAAPTVEQVRHVLTSYGVDPFDGSYGVPQYDALVDDLAALWGAR